MNSIGEILKSERIRRNISIEKISKETNLNKFYIIALEEDDFDNITGKFYYYMYLKSYINALGLDKKNFMEKNKELLDIVDNYYKEPVDKVIKSIRYKRFKRNKYLGFLLILLSVFIILYLLYITDFYKKIIYVLKPSIYLRNPDTGSLIYSDRILMEKLLYDYSFDFSPYNVKLIFKKGCWIRVRKSNNIIDENIYKRGDIKEYSGYDIKILISNPNNVEVFINNNKIKIPENINKYYLVKIDVRNKENINRKWLY